jgi:hypothetical protein
MDAQEIKQLKELQDAYLSVYEAKKVDQDGDNDTDFADVRIARMIASGMSREEAIRRVKDKEYNEDYKPWDFGPKDKAKAKYDKLAKRKAAGGSAPGTATRANKIASVGREMRTTLDKDSAMTMTNPKKQGLQPSTQRHTLAAMRGAGGGTTARTKFRKEEFELWVNDLLDEGYDLSDYTWDEMYESYLDEATRMRKELGQEGETKTRQELARRSNAYQRSGSVDNTIAAAERGAKNPYVARGKNETEADHNKRKQEKSQTLTKLASNRRKSVRSGEGLRGYAAKVEGGDKDLQSARGSARSAGTLTPKEKKQLGEQYNLVLSYLLDEGYANTQESAEIIIANMSESWIESIVESLI